MDLANSRSSLLTELCTTKQPCAESEEEEGVQAADLEGGTLSDRCPLHSTPSGLGENIAGQPAGLQAWRRRLLPMKSLDEYQAHLPSHLVVFDMGETALVTILPLCVSMPDTMLRIIRFNYRISPCTSHPFFPKFPSPKSRGVAYI
ncbi:unnamed protein product [Protopolystoma xenopodis]|uniref:Uncharacterized protein n=1 Tax=Protopolystoma xenopodis TaxID=117903 RepID=A0A448XPT3_9PLAT|nr:unnamed protein product [Protopolystoma xenopodis]